MGGKLRLCFYGDPFKRREYFLRDDLTSLFRTFDSESVTSVEYVNK